MADYIRPTPRNPILGLLADALTGGVDWMRDPRRAQQMQGIGGLLAETGIPATMERLSYGEPLTKGKGMTTRLRPEAEAALMTLGPEAVPIGRGAMAAVKATKGLPVGAGIRQVAPQEEALRLAQQRAALPVSEGGLGLPPNNTPMDRARAMGFVNESYHGTKATDIDALKAGKGRFGKAVYTSDMPEDAVGYAIGQGYTGGENVLPLLTKEPTVAYAGGRINAFINPRDIRSRFAAFDPTRRNEPDLLAGALPFTALLDEENRALLEERLGGLLGR